MKDLKLATEIVKYTLSHPRHAVILSKELINPSNSIVPTIGFVDKKDAFLSNEVIPFTHVYKSWQIANIEELLSVIKALGFEPNLEQISIIDFTKPFYCVVAWMPDRI